MIKVNGKRYSARVHHPIEGCLNPAPVPEHPATALQAQPPEGPRVSRLPFTMNAGLFARGPEHPQRGRAYAKPLDHDAFMTRSSPASTSIAAGLLPLGGTVHAPSPVSRLGRLPRRVPRWRRQSPRMMGRPCRGRARAPTPDEYFMPLERTEGADHHPSSLRVEVEGHQYLHDLHGGRGDGPTIRAHPTNTRTIGPLAEGSARIGPWILDVPIGLLRSPSQPYGPQFPNRFSIYRLNRGMPGRLWEGRAPAWWTARE